MVRRMSTSVSDGGEQIMPCHKAYTFYTLALPSLPRSIDRCVFLIQMSYYERCHELLFFCLFQLMVIQLYRHREARKAYQRKYSLAHLRAARRKVGKAQREADSALWNIKEAMQLTRYVCWPWDACNRLISAVSVYLVVLMTRIRLLEQRSQTVASVERSLSVYISELQRYAVALVKSAASCPEWELACVLCMTPSLEALAGGDFSKLEGDICDAGIEETEFNLFAEGEEDNGICFALTAQTHY